MPFRFDLLCTFHTHATLELSYTTSHTSHVTRFRFCLFAASRSVQPPSASAHLPWWQVISQRNNVFGFMSLRMSVVTRHGFVVLEHFSRAFLPFISRRISPSSGTSDGCVFVWGSALGPEAPARRFAADPFLVLPLAFHGTSAAT